jgi:hypothetical protein
MPPVEMPVFWVHNREDNFKTVIAIQNSGDHL